MSKVFITDVFCLVLYSDCIADFVSVQEFAHFLILVNTPEALLFFFALNDMKITMMSVGGE